MSSCPARNTVEGRADRENARIAYVKDDGQVNSDWNNRDNDNRNHRFRPAAMIYTAPRNYSLTLT